MGLQAGLFGGHVEAGRAGKVIGVGEGERGHAEVRRGGDEVLRCTGAFEETEGGAGMEFDVHGLVIRSVDNPVRFV